MKALQRRILSVFFAITLSTPAAGIAHELAGWVEAELRLFFHEPLLEPQRHSNGSLAAEPEYYHEWENGSSFIFVPFGRLDSADSQRIHFDIRELNYLYPAQNWELRAGIGKVFWGVTEFVHLADVINQSDFVEGIDGEDKLGQPMVHLSVPRPWGVLDFFVLPYFREMTFPGERGRLRFALPVDTDNPVYESGARQNHVDYAIRYSHTLAGLDFGIYHFYGTSRVATLLPDFDDAGKPEALFPFYPIVQQTGLDAQLVLGQWLLKLESIYQSGGPEDFFAAAGGVEYTFVAVGDTAIDVGVIAEYAYDGRSNRALTIYQNDVMTGLRVSFNDMAGTELLFGCIVDLENTAQLISIEGSRRLSDHLRLIAEGGVFMDVSDSNILYSFRDDDFIRLRLAYYF